MRQRVHGLKLTHGDAPRFALVEGVGSLLPGRQADELSAMVAEHRPALIVIDTLAMAFPGIDESTSHDMGRVIAFARSLTEHGAAVVLIHHDTKAQDGTPRGHSLFNGALDVSLQLGRQGDDGIIRGKLVKNRNGPCDATLAFRIRSAQIGTDEDGDLITAPVAVEVDERQEKPQEPKLSRSAAAALDVLEELAKLSGEPTADGRSPVAVEDWRAECVDNFRVSSSPDREARARAFRRAFDTLKELPARRNSRRSGVGVQRWFGVSAAARRTGQGGRTKAFPDIVRFVRPANR